MSAVTDSERRLLVALAWMCEQHLKCDDGLDHMCVSAGEHAIDLLVQYGLVEPGPRGGTWTELGQALLDSN